MSKNNQLFFDDIKKLCVTVARAITVISNEHSKNPEDVSRLLIETYNMINVMAGDYESD